MKDNKTIAKFLQDNKQVLYSLSMLIIVPGVIVLNTWLFSDSFKDTVEFSLSVKGMEIGQAVNTALSDKLDDPNQIQEFIEDWKVYNEETKLFDIYYKEGDAFKLVASSDKKDVGNVFETGAFTGEQSGRFNVANFYGMAWNESNAMALKVTDSKDVSGYYWLVVSPLKDKSGERKALMAMRVSNDIVESSLTMAIFKSYGVLALSVIAIILLLLVNSRLFGYVVLYNKIKEVDEMKDEFISMASHELRTPVTVMRGYVSMILDEQGSKGLDEETKEYLGIIKVSTERLNNLIEDLLNVSRIEQGRMKMNNERIAGKAVVEETVKEFGVQAREKGLELLFQPDEQLSDEILVDKDKFKQVLINIIGNAVKYTPSGSVAVVLKNKDSSLQIFVRDTGIGMSAKEREHLFEKFYRIKNEKTEDIIGTGLGLWITKQIIEIMGGTISVDSMENVGTQFMIQIPLVKTK